MLTIPKRLALLPAAALLLCGLAACGSDDASGSDAEAKDGAKIYAAIPTENSGTWDKFKAAIEGVAKSTGSGEANLVVDNFDPQKQLQLLSPILATGCENCAMTFIPISAANEKPLLRQAEQAGTYVVTQYIKAEGNYPWDVSKNFVAHITFDGVDGGYQTAKSLFEKMGGKGNIIALQGTPGPGAGDDKATGLHKALDEFPDINVLSEQVADWQQEKAQDVTQTLLTQYGDDIGGIWTANDGMAVGVVEALRAAKLNGKIPVTGMDGGDDTLALIKSGDMYNTMFDSGALIGAVGTALAYGAAVGDVDPDKLSHDQRYFFLQHELVTADNVADYLDKPIDPALLSYDELKKDFWAYSAGPIPVK